jgi:hypothetical protein
LQTLLKKFPVCCSAARLLIYIYILHEYCLILCRIQTDRDRERPGRPTTWVVNNKFYISWEKKEDKGKWNRMKKEPNPFSGKREKKRKQNFWPENSHVFCNWKLAGSSGKMSVLQSIFFFWVRCKYVLLMTINLPLPFPPTKITLTL